MRIFFCNFLCKFPRSNPITGLDSRIKLLANSNWKKVFRKQRPVIIEQLNRIRELPFCTKHHSR